jgi:ATP-dependent helicase/nuclease subunit B
MLAKILLVPNTDTAIKHAIAQISEVRKENALYPVQILMPTADSLHLVRKRLGNAMGIYLYQFYALGQYILDAAGISVQWLDETATRRLVHHILHEMHEQGELTTFDAVWDKPGFTQAMLNWLREMKAQGISPEEFEADAPHSENSRDAQLLLLYQRYQTFLQENALSDSDGLLWLAAEALENDPTLLQGEGLVIALGFDQFTPIQTRILRAYAERFDYFSVYLPWDNSRTEESLVHTRLREVRSDLENIFPEIKSVALADSSETNPDLQQLQGLLFEDQESMGGATSVRAYATPSRETEVRIALREIKKLLLNGTAPIEISLLVPKPGIYHRMVELVADEYGIPISYETTLGSNPAAQAILNLLGLAPNFPRKKTFEALRSPYIQQDWLTEEEVDYLVQLTRERPVISGISQWLEALTPIEFRNSREEDEELGPEKLASKLSKERLGEIKEGLLAFFTHLTPPTNGTHREYTLWIQERILGLIQDEDEGSPDAPLSLNFLFACEHGLHPERDLNAIKTVLQHLKHLVDATDLVLSSDEGQIFWDIYRSDLFEVIPNLRISPESFDTAVQFGALEVGRDRPIQHLFVMGLSEGEFPSAPAPDPLFAATERVSYPTQYGINLRSPYPADDASLWWLVLSNCHQSLTLLRPAIDEGGAPWEPSPYWEEVVNKGSVSVTQIKVGYSPNVEDATSPAELLAALAQRNTQEVPEALNASWEAAQSAFNVMQLRHSWKPAPTYEGLLEADDIRVILSTRFGENHSWSASRLNRYGSCPFGFFAQYVLNLDEDYEPEEGMDVMQRGSLLHAILEELHRKLAVNGIVLAPETQPQILAELDEVCVDIFSTAPKKLGFRPNALWKYEQEELKNLLAALVRWECENPGLYLPFEQEFRFGVKGSEAPAYPLVTSNEEAFLFHGVVDRIDRTENDELRILDYKSGSTTYSKKDMAEGLAFQNPLYAIVVKNLLEKPVLSSAYLLIPKRDFSGKLKFSEGHPEDDETVQSAIDQVGNFVHQIRSGYFPNLPAKPTSGSFACSSYCPFSSMCRVDRRSVAKVRRMEAQDAA